MTGQAIKLSRSPENVIPIEPNPQYNSIMLATGAKTVEKISITLLNMNLSYAVIIDEKTLIGKAMAVLNAIITINILSLSTPVA